jgi:hypothetical protein
MTQNSRFFSNYVGTYLTLSKPLLSFKLILTAQVIDTVDNNYTGIIPLLDLQAFKDAVLSPEWFLSKQNILGNDDLH